MDDDLDLLHDSDRPSRRPPWALLAGIVAVALLTLVGVGWTVGAVVSGRGTGTPATPAAAGTATPRTTVPAAATLPATAAPATPRRTTPAPTFTVPTVPLPSAVTVAPAPATPAPTIPARTTPAPRPAPTATTPAAGRLAPVPDVVGLRVTAATATLRAAGFKVAVLGGVLSPDRDRRRVIAQRPTPGTLARTGSTVILVSDSL